VTRRVGGIVGRGHASRWTPGLQLGNHPCKPRLLGDRRAIAAARLPSEALVAPLGLLEIGEHELGLDGLDVAQRIDAALGVHDALIVVRAHDVYDRVGLADVGEEPVAEALPLMRAAHEPGDVVEVDRVRNDLAGAHDAREQLEALVAYGHDGHVWLDRGEGVVGGLGTCAGEGVEERGLARVGHAYDPDPRAHRALKQRWTRRPSAAPSSAPPSTSEG